MHERVVLNSVHKYPVFYSMYHNPVILAIQIRLLAGSIVSAIAGGIKFLRKNIVGVLF